MLIIFCIVLALGVLAYKAQWDDKAILCCLLLCTTYYCLGGAFYWAYVRGGIFCDANWGPEIVVKAAVFLAIGTLLWAICIVVFSSLSEQGRFAHVPRSGDNQVLAPELAETPTSAFWLFLAMGGIAATVVLKSSSFSPAGEFSLVTPPWFFLIAFQFSDMLIPLLIYMIATRGYTRLVFVLIGYFVLYAILTGLRYKLALLFLPILWDMLGSNRSVFFKMGVAVLIGVGGLVLFSIMTLYRVKFGIPDLSIPLTNPSGQLLYGLFADSNILIGQSSINANYADAGRLFTFQPMVDSITQFLPHFLFPTRYTGSYAWPMYLGMGTYSGAHSGTAWPWLGEFMIMFGWPAVVIAPAIMLLIYVAFKSKLRKSCATVRQYWLGLALVATTLAYYQFSRGFWPPIIKAYIWVVAPYFYLCYLDMKRSVRVDPVVPLTSATAVA